MGGMDVDIHIILTLALVGGERSASLHGRFTTRERGTRTHWRGGWVLSRAGQNSWPYRDSNSSDPSVVQPVASRYTD
jgi:hypothetical protein